MICGTPQKCVWYYYYFIWHQQPTKNHSFIGKCLLLFRFYLFIFLIVLIYLFTIVVFFIFSVHYFISQISFFFNIFMYVLRNVDKTPKHQNIEILFLSSKHAAQRHRARGCAVIRSFLYGISCEQNILQGAITMKRWHAAILMMALSLHLFAGPQFLR